VAAVLRVAGILRTLPAARVRHHPPWRFRTYLLSRRGALDGALVKWLRRRRTAIHAPLAATFAARRRHVTRDRRRRRRVTLDIRATALGERGALVDGRGRRCRVSAASHVGTSALARGLARFERRRCGVTATLDVHAATITPRPALF